MYEMTDAVAICFFISSNRAPTTRPAAVPAPALVQIGTGLTQPRDYGRQA